MSARRTGWLLALVGGLGAAGAILFGSDRPPGEAPVLPADSASESPAPDAAPAEEPPPEPDAAAPAPAGPDRAERLRRKGYRALRADRLDEAIAAFGAYLKLRPDSEKIRKLRARLEERRVVEADFERYESGRFAIKFAPQAKDVVLRGLSDHLETAWSDVGQILGHYPEGTLGVVVYADREAYRRATGAPDWMGALFDGRVRIPVDPERIVDASLERIVRHEMTHFVLRDRAGRKVPQWLHEGLAQHLAGEERKVHRETYRLFATNNTYIPIRSIEESFMVFDRETTSRAYHQSLSMARYILEQHGAAGLERLLQAYKAGRKTEDAFVEAFDLTLDEFQRQWFEELQERWSGG